jgi:TAG lipase/steryl ester hydrolase/phospholipase A2/LPA acyltransferase
MSSLAERSWHLLTLVPGGLEHLLFEVIDSAFAPRQVAKQVVCILALQTAIIAGRAVYAGYRYGIRHIFSEKERIRRRLEERLVNAKSYEEWREVAEQIDVLDGNDVWRSEDQSPLIDARILRRRTHELRVMMKNKDIFHLIYRLRSGLARDKYGVQHAALFSLARGGTKHVIEEYHSAVCDALSFVCDTEDPATPLDARLAFFNETRHSYGRTALLLSGGASLGFYHIGLAKCLFLQNLLPRVISGASAGSLMAAMLGTRTEEELLNMINTGAFRKDFFRMNEWQNTKEDGLTARLQYLFPQGVRWLTDAVLGFLVDRKSVLSMDTDHLRNRVIEAVGIWTFQEAFDRTGRIINIVVAPLNKYEAPRLLNYLTAPHLCVWSAVVASCAIPGVFESISLVVKEPDGNYKPEHEVDYLGAEGDGGNGDKDKEHYSDGSIERDLPMQQLSELFNVNHFIVSQVNPHSFLLSSLAIHVDAWTPMLYGALVGYLRFLKAQCRDWLRNAIDLLVYRSLSPEWAAKRGFSQILTQEYEGKPSDVNIMPWAGDLSIWQAFLSLVRNPTNEEYQRIVQVSERNTWPQIARIKAHCQVEMTLDRAVQSLRRRIALEEDGHHMTSMDRTPSFYTTRSILNLSGLNVLDQAGALIDTGANSESGEGKMGIKKSTRFASLFWSCNSPFLRLTPSPLSLPFNPQHGLLLLLSRRRITGLARLAKWVGQDVGQQLSKRAHKLLMLPILTGSGLSF